MKVESEGLDSGGSSLTEKSLTNERLLIGTQNEKCIRNNSQNQNDKHITNNSPNEKIRIRNSSNEKFAPANSKTDKFLLNAKVKQESFLKSPIIRSEKKKITSPPKFPIGMNPAVHQKEANFNFYDTHSLSNNNLFRTYISQPQIHNNYSFFNPYVFSMNPVDLSLYLGQTGGMGEMGGVHMGGRGCQMGGSVEGGVNLGEMEGGGKYAGEMEQHFQNNIPSLSNIDLAAGKCELEENGGNDRRMEQANFVTLRIKNPKDFNSFEDVGSLFFSIVNTKKNEIYYLDPFIPNSQSSWPSQSSASALLNLQNISFSQKNNQSLGSVGSVNSAFLQEKEGFEGKIVF